MALHRNLTHNSLVGTDVLIFLGNYFCYKYTTGGDQRGGDVSDCYLLQKVVTVVIVLRDR